MTKRLVAALCLIACAGCRTDGGFDRRDLAHGLEFSTTRFADRTAYDAHRTWYLASSVPGAIAGSFSEAAENVADTYSLYLETHTHRDR